jgi:hypothetical protein
MAKKSPLSVKDYERLGRTLESIFEGGYINHKRVYWINLVRGIFFGFGTAVGGTILIALVIWILSLLTGAPIVGNFIESLKESIQQQ